VRRLASGTIVNVTLPDIERQPHSTFSDLQWVIKVGFVLITTVTTASP